MTESRIGHKSCGDSKNYQAQRKSRRTFFGRSSAALAEGEKVTLVGLERVSVGARSAREGRKSQNSDKITIPASKVV